MHVPLLLCMYDYYNIILHAHVGLHLVGNSISQSHSLVWQLIATSTDPQNVSICMVLCDGAPLLNVIQGGHRYWDTSRPLMGYA